MIFQYNAANIYYESHGSGPAVVLLHGFLESSTMWKRLIPELSNANTVIIPDLPGHGKSDVLGEVHSMEEMAKMLNALLDFLQIPSAAFIGHSMGGYVLLAFTELFSEKTNGVLLLNSTPEADSEERKRNRERALRLIPKNPDIFIKAAITSLFAETGAENYKEEISRLQKEALGFPTQGIMAMIRGMKERKDRTFVLKNYSGKKFMLSGDKDPLISLSEAQNIAKKTKTELKVVDAGHMILIENWDKFHKIVHFIDFL